MTTNSAWKLCLFCLLPSQFFLSSLAKKDRFRQLTEAELEALDDDWEDEDDIEPLDLPEWKRPKPDLGIDVSKVLNSAMGQKLDPAQMEAMNQQVLMDSKKHQTLMIFVRVIDKKLVSNIKNSKSEIFEPKNLATRKFTEDISERWESMLHNAHLFGSRYITEEDTFLLKLDDGSKAFEMRDFLVQQEECYKVTIEQKDYLGRGHVEFSPRSEL